MSVVEYQRKPTRVKAIQWTGKNLNEIWDAFGVSGIYGPTELNPDQLILTTTNGHPVPCPIGSWVIPDANPETFYPCDGDVFAKTYEPVKDAH